MKILFIRSENAFLPEIDAYIEYFNGTEEFEAYDSSKLKEGYQLKDFDVIWEFKGFGGIKAKNQVVVHEYASLSTGTFPKVKNLIKSKINPIPDLRIFLNEYVKDGFGFKDNVDHSLRDMGINKNFLEVKDIKKEYDFVYVGSICKAREMDKFLREFTRKPNGKLCLIGNVDDEIYNAYKKNKDIIFTGKVPYSEVPKIASKSIYGVNYIPDKYPFNIQTSTKLLEYLALGLQIVTTDYIWVREFEKKHNSIFYKLDYHNLNFDFDTINKYDFISNFKAKDFLWESIIRNTQITNKIKNKVAKC